MSTSTYFFLIALCVGSLDCAAQSKSTAAPVIPEAYGYTIISNAKIQPNKTKTYKVIFDATRAATDSSQILPALNMTGAELNGLGVWEIPLTHAKFVIVFHGAAINGILDDEHYKAKFGIANPNLKVISALKKAGVQIFVCGQNLLAEKIDSKFISPDVAVASDALMVLMTFESAGYALLSF